MSAKFKAWVPVLAPLLSIIADQYSPDDVLNDFMAVGFNFELPADLEGKYGPRKRAYITKVQKWINQLDTASQWNLARALATRLNGTRGHLVRQILEGVGWTFDGMAFAAIETGNIDQHVFFPAGAVHDAFVHIRSLFKGASRELFIIDGYVDATLFEFLLTTNGPKKCRILTNMRSLPTDFVTEAKHFTTQHGFDVSIRSGTDFHDRGIIVDGSEAFMLGASIKDAGKRAFNIMPIENVSIRDEMIRYAEAVWNKATLIL
jgi:hypothetical protein